MTGYSDTDAYGRDPLDADYGKPMPADERATLLREQITRIVNSFGTLRTWDEAPRHNLIENLVGGISAHVLESALKEADRLAREDAARILDAQASAIEAIRRAAHPPHQVFFDPEINLYRKAAAAIRASITTEEGE